VERVQTIAAGSAQEVPSLAPMDGTVPPFEALARDAREKGGEALVQLEHAVKICPSTLRGSESLIALLESAALEGLSFSTGVDAREVAVEKLLTLDVHALRVPPEQLEWLRAQQSRRRLAKVIAVAVAIGSVAFAALEFVWLTT
jgi:hypothetical protein